MTLKNICSHILFKIRPIALYGHNCFLLYYLRSSVNALTVSNFPVSQARVLTVSDFPVSHACVASLFNHYKLDILGLP